MALYVTHSVPWVPKALYKGMSRSRKCASEQSSPSVCSCHSSTALELSLLQMEGLAQRSLNYFPPSNFHKLLNSYMNDQRNTGVFLEIAFIALPVKHLVAGGILFGFYIVVFMEWDLWFRSVACMNSA